MIEKESKLKKIRKDHSDQLGEVSRRNTKVKEILRGVIESGSGSQSDSSPPSSPDRLSPPSSPDRVPSPLSPSPEDGGQIAIHMHELSEESQLADRRVYQRKHRQGTAVYSILRAYLLSILTRQRLIFDVKK